MSHRKVAGIFGRFPQRLALREFTQAMDVNSLGGEGIELVGYVPRQNDVFARLTPDMVSHLNPPVQIESHHTESHRVHTQPHDSISHAGAHQTVQQAWTPSIARLWRLEAQRRFEHLRDKILGAAPESVLDLPMANWVASADRGLPMALLGGSLGSMLRRPFDNLCATPSIGVKKITALLELLSRAADEVLGGPKPAALAMTRPPELPVRSHEAVFPGLSEAQWQAWRQRLRCHELSKEPLGRLVSSLRDLPRNMWRTPLSTYCDLTLSQLHDLPIHGKKRVRAILQTFQMLDVVVENLERGGNFALTPQPRFARAIQSFDVRVRTSAKPVTVADIETNLCEPILQQLRLDALPQVNEVVTILLSERGPLSFRQIARKHDMARARVRDALHEAREVLRLRWPDGPGVVQHLLVRFQASGQADEVIDLMCRVVQLFRNEPEVGATAAARHNSVRFEDEFEIARSSV